MPRARYRRVRTPEGAKRYGVPIGSIIRVDRDHDRPKKDTDDEKRPAPSGGATPPPKDPPKPPASPTGPDDEDDEDDGTEDVDPEEALDELLDKAGGALVPDRVDPPKGEVPDPAAVRHAASDTAVQQLLADQIDGRYEVDGEDVDVHVSRVAVRRNDAGDVEGFTATLEYSREGRGVARSEFSAQVDEQGMELSDRGSLDNPTIDVDGPERLAVEFLLRELTPQLSEHFNRWPEMGHDERAPIGTGRAPDYLGHPNDPAAALFAELAAADEDDDIPRYKQLNRQIRQLPEGEAFRGEAIHSAEQGLQEAASEAGMSPEELVEIANGGLTQFLNGRQLAITVRTDSVQAIVEDGRFRSQREPGAIEGGAIFDPKDRERKENGWFGEHDWPPIYAYVRDANGARSKAQGYGSVTFVLDDRVRERATVSVTDSLVHWRSVFPGPANAPGRYSGDPVRAASSGARTPEEYANYLAEGSRPGETSGFYRDHYVEAQIHGGVPLSDVSEVVFADEDTARLYRAMLERAGLSFRVESPHAFDGGEPEEREWDA